MLGLNAWWHRWEGNSLRHQLILFFSTTTSFFILSPTLDSEAVEELEVLKYEPQDIVINRADITADIKQMSQNFAAGSYEAAGGNLGDGLHKVLIGGANQQDQDPDIAAGLFVRGLLKGFGADVEQQCVDKTSFGLEMGRLIHIGPVSHRFQTGFRPVSTCRMHSPCHSRSSPPYVQSMSPCLLPHACTVSSPIHRGPLLSDCHNVIFRRSSVDRNSGQQSRE